VAAALAAAFETQPEQGLNHARAGNARQFRHPSRQTW
jgi:hypothetical protein